MKFKAIIQARTSSKRLPKKVMEKILDKTMLEHVVFRVSKSKFIDEIIVATTLDEEDDAICKLAKKMSVECFRGSKYDVLDRYYNCALKHGAKNIVRVTADDPFKDPLVIDELIKEYKNKNFDYINNFSTPTYPEGLDIEVFNFNALEKAFFEATLEYEREHVTPYIWMNNRDKFKIGCLALKENFSNYRLTVDTTKDLIFAKKIYEKLYKSGKMFYLDDIMELLKKDKEVLNLMPKIRRNDSLMKSLEER